MLIASTKPETLAVVPKYSVETTICCISREDSFFPQVLLCRCQRLGLLLHHPNASCGQLFHPAIQHLVYLYKFHIPLVKNSKLWASRFLQVSLQARYNLVQRIGWVRSAILRVCFQNKHVIGGCSDPLPSSFQSTPQSPFTRTTNSIPSDTSLWSSECSWEYAGRYYNCANLLVPNRRAEASHFLCFG